MGFDFKTLEKSWKAIHLEGAAFYPPHDAASPELRNIFSAFFFKYKNNNTLSKLPLLYFNIYFKKRSWLLQANSSCTEKKKFQMFLSIQLGQKHDPRACSDLCHLKSSAAFSWWKEMKPCLASSSCFIYVPINTFYVHVFIASIYCFYPHSALPISKFAHLG